jgi:hypothetical protein
MSQNSDNRVSRSQLPLKKLLSLAITLLAGFGAGTIFIYQNNAQGKASPKDSRARQTKSFDDQINANVAKMINEGRQTFRFDTFGDEAGSQSRSNRRGRS